MIKDSYHLFFDFWLIQDKIPSLDQTSTNSTMKTLFADLVYSQVQNKRGRGDIYFFMIFGDPPPPAAYLTPSFINLSNFSRGYTEVHKYIIDS